MATRDVHTPPAGQEAIDTGAASRESGNSEHASSWRADGSGMWPLASLLAGCAIHTLARSGSYLGLYGNFGQDALVIAGLLLIFAPALHVLWKSLVRPLVRRLILWGIVCGLIHFTLNLGDSIPLLMGYWLFSDNHVAHVIAQEFFSSASFALLGGGLFYSIVFYQMSEAAVALERDHLKAEIAERKRAEEQQRKLETQLAQAQKMESVGRLAGGVAHDFNNLLAVILGYADVVLDDPAREPSLIRSDVQQILEAAERGSSLTKQLLAFARKQTLEMRAVNLNEVIRGFEKMLRRLIGEDVQINAQLDPAIGAIEADTAQIEQALLNLAVNARDAMPNGGSLTVETAGVVLDEVYATTHGIAPGAYVKLTVRDTGCGMDAETQQMIFEPFFTTKGHAKGTGLGLATVYGIVKQHRGHVSVSSEVGAGTAFTLYFPQNEARQAVSSPSAPVGLARGTETILVVEDDPSVRNLMRCMLTGLGYDVIEAGNGDEAIRLATARESIHLLLSDVIMREMNGREVRERIAALHPEMKTLFMSGYTADVIAHHGVLDPGVHLLHKPFKRDDLAKKIREVLGE